MQPIHGKNINGLKGDDTRPDIRAGSLNRQIDETDWRNRQNTFIEIRVTNTNAISQNHLSPTKVLDRHEKEKQHLQNNRVMNIEHDTFTPLVFLFVGKECFMLRKLITQKIAKKTDKRYDKIISSLDLQYIFLSCDSALRVSEEVGHFKNLNLLTTLQLPKIVPNTAGNYMFKVNNRNSRTRRKICSKLTIKIPERHQLLSSLLTLNIFHSLF